MKEKRKYDKIEFENGAKYCGELLDNKRDGYGIYIWSDGTKYEGIMKNFKLNFLEY